MAGAVLSKRNWVLLRSVTEVQSIGRFLNSDQIVFHFSGWGCSAWFETSLAAEAETGKRITQDRARGNIECERVHSFDHWLADEDLFSFVIPSAIDIKINPGIDAPIPGHSDFNLGGAAGDQWISQKVHAIFVIQIGGRTGRI